ncbi:DUF433 domain-containing protein [Nostoc sp. CMAA1605]|nr:DUF433 domain-containing protein [Nostoc sp. CMAA1605]
MTVNPRQCGGRPCIRGMRMPLIIISYRLYLIIK